MVYCIPLSAFNAQPHFPRSIVAGVLLNLPIFFASIIFIYSFNLTPHPEVAFGSNLLGAGIGGCWNRCRSPWDQLFLVLVGALYAASFACLKLPRARAPAGAIAPRPADPA